MGCLYDDWVDSKIPERKPKVVKEKVDPDNWRHPALPPIPDVESDNEIIARLEIEVAFWKNEAEEWQDSANNSAAEAMTWEMKCHQMMKNYN